VSLPKSIGIKLYDDSFVPVLTEGEIKSKKLILTTVKDNQEKAIIELYEGNSDKCINNEYLGKLVIAINRETVKGEPGIEVHLRLSDEGMLYAKAWDTESGTQSEVKIEHSESRRIFQETMSDDEIKGLSGAGNSEKVESISEETYEENKPKSGINAVRTVLVVLIIIIFLALLTLLGIFLYNSWTKMQAENKTKNEERLKIEEQKKVDEENQRLADEKKKQEEERLAKLKEEQEAEKNKVQTTEVQGKKHYIRWGDNLWNICKRYYKDPWYYPSLAEVNNIKVPRKIFAGTYLIIPDKSSLTRWDFKK
jgi:molecular chaperone DnaK (HSP70)